MPFVSEDKENQENQEERERERERECVCVCVEHKKKKRTQVDFHTGGTNWSCIYKREGNSLSFLSLVAAEARGHGLLEGVDAVEVEEKLWQRVFFRVRR